MEQLSEGMPEMQKTCKCKQKAPHLWGAASDEKRKPQGARLARLSDFPLRKLTVYLCIKSAKSDSSLIAHGFRRGDTSGSRT